MSRINQLTQVEDFSVSCIHVQEWAHDAARKEVPTVNNFGGYAVATERGDVVVARPKQLQKNPFTTHGSVINGAKLGPHRAWDPV